MNKRSSDNFARSVEMNKDFGFGWRSVGKIGCEISDEQKPANLSTLELKV